jgi:hypothetical protein
MKTNGTSWRYLALLAVLVSCGLPAFAGRGNNKKETPKPLPPEVVKAWGDAGAKVGWMKDVPPEPTDGYDYWEPFREEVEPGALPAFHFHPKSEGVLTKLPNPGVAFGLDTSCWGLTARELKELARLKSLRSLNLGGDLLLTDAALKELAGQNNLHALYLFYTHVTDTGLKELVGLKELRTLDLSHTQVRDAGLKKLAGLKSLQALNLSYTTVTDVGLRAVGGMKNLQWLSLHRTRVTAAGVAALQKELPPCKIIFRTR